MKISLSVLATLSLAGCGSAPAAPATTPAAPDPGRVASSATPSPAPATAATDAPPAQRPLDLVSSCPNDVHVYFGEQPGDGKGQATTVHTGTTTPVPRGPDGTTVVWVTDDKGAGLASVHITKHMRHVRIDTTCSRLDADSTR